MTYAHAVITVDHHKAQITRFNAEDHETIHLKAKVHDTPQHNSSVRDEHEFFAEVSDSVSGLDEVLVTGSKTSLSDFKHFVEKHRPLIAPHIVAYETIDHPTEGQLVAFARTFFDSFIRPVVTSD